MKISFQAIAENSDLYLSTNDQRNFIGYRFIFDKSFYDHFRDRMGNTKYWSFMNFIKKKRPP